MKTFWIENQKFLLGCGGALILFFAANSTISGLAEGAEETYVECRDLQKQIDQLHKELRRTYWAEIDRVGALEAQEAMLREDVCLPPNPDLSSSKSLLVDFNKKVAKIWSDVQAEASARGLVLPPKLVGRDFGVGPEYGPEEFATIHSYLDVTGRALKASVAAGMTRIVSLRVNNPEPAAVHHDEEVIASCAYLGVSLKVQGPYEAFGKILELLQQPKTFAQVRIAGRMVPVRGDDDVLQAELDFYGLSFLDEESDELLEEDDDGDDQRRRR